MTKDEALKLALEALGEIEWSNNSQWQSDRAKVAITAIKEALAQPEQEPVARVIDNGTPEGATEWIPFTNRVEPLKTGDLLYGEPPKRTWVGLTEVDMLDASRHWRHAEDFLAGVYWAAGTLKEFNT